MNNNILSPRERVKQVFQEKINKIKQDKQAKKDEVELKKKLEEDAVAEQKRVNSDPRVTDKMKKLFITALQSFPGLDLDNPSEILDNKDECTLTYYKSCIEVMKNDKSNGEILNNAYYQYMREVLGLN
jgi:hypothetical protein